MKLIKSMACMVLVSAVILCPSAFAVNTSADASIAIDALTGEVICEKNAYTKMGMASTTKIMTAIIALEKGNLTDIVTVDKRAVGVEGSSLYLSEGDTLSLKNLLYGMMLRSGNDGATAVALHFAPSVEEFSKMMNEKAAELGLSDTNFKNPHGLYEEGHYTTAYDLAQITRYGFTLPEFAEIVKCWAYNIDENIETKRVVNNNKLLNMYDGADGVKTGFTPETGRTLVGSATRDGMRVITVTLNDKEDWNDHMAMFDYAFSKYKSLSLAEKGKGYGCVPVKGGKDIEIACVAKDDFAVMVEKDATISVDIKTEEEIKAPIKKGQVLGKAIFTINGENIGEMELVAPEAMERKNKPNIFWRIINWIMGK